jgi:Flp pilus assembly protein TadG
MNFLKAIDPRRRPRGSRGQALVEFALVAPVFFLMLFSLIDFGRYVYYVQILNNAAREGSRYAIVHGSASLNPSGPPESGTTSTDPAGNNVKAVVRAWAVGVISNGTSLTVTPCWLDSTGGCNTGTSNNARGSQVQVIVGYDFTTLIPVPLPPIHVEGASTLVINH